MLGCFAYDVSPDVGCYETWGAEGCGAAVWSEKSDQPLFSNQITKWKIIHSQAVLGKIPSFVSFSKAFSTFVPSLKVGKSPFPPPSQSGATWGRTKLVVFLMFCFFNVQVVKPQETLVTAVEVLNPDLELIRQGSFSHLSMDFHHRVWCSGGGKQRLRKGYNASMCMWWCAVLINHKHTFSS